MPINKIRRNEFRSSANLNINALDSGNTNVYYGKRKKGNNIAYRNIKLDGRTDRNTVLNYFKNDSNYEENYTYAISCWFLCGQKTGKLFTSESINDDIIMDLDKFYDNGDDNTDQTIKHVSIYKWRTPELQGGYDDYHNDCLFNCLKTSSYTLPKQIASAVGLKKYLQLNRNDKIDIKHLSQIEDLLIKNNCSVTCSGDYQYQSEHVNKFNKNINLKLLNGHYTIHDNLNRDIEKPYKRFQNFFPIAKSKHEMYVMIDNKIYNGVEYKILERKHKTDFLAKNIVIHCKINTHKKTELECEEIMKTTYDDYIKKCDEMLKETNGQVNLYKYRSIRFCALEILRMKSKNIKAFSQITTHESEILMNSFGGGLTYINKKMLNIETNAITYDINSAHPCNMKSNNMLPMGEPTFHKLKNINMENIEYGCYHCEIIGECHDSFLYRKSNNWYTHYDLQIAKMLTLNIEMINDNKYNCMIYPQESLLKASDIFGHYVDFFSKIKSNSDDNKPLRQCSKDFLNILYGGLASKNKIIKRPTENKPFEITEHHHIHLLSTENNKTTITLNDRQNYYKSNYAKMSIFISALSRRKLFNINYKIIQTYGTDSILRCHTDSVCVKRDLIENIESPIPEIKISNLMGQFKIEKKGKIIMKGLNQVKWELN